MADARAEQIMVAVKTAVTGLTTTGANVQRGQVYPHESNKLPALGVLMGPDVPAVELQTALLDWELTVAIECAVQADIYNGSESGIETDLAQIRKEVHAALFADHTLGLSFVLDIEPGPAQQPQISGDGNFPIGSMVLNFVIHYRTSRTDISA